jgi:hypothetical protein
MIAESLLFLQADLLAEIIFCTEFWHKVKGHLNESVKCMQTMTITQ